MTRSNTRAKRRAPVLAGAAAALVGAFVLRPATAPAQVPQAAASESAQRADSVFARARKLVVNGSGAAGRLLVDSVITATPPNTPAYGEALYWRAALAATSGEAERDYRRVVVEYPGSPHAGDALLQLAQLERARGDRVGAATHLERYLLDYPSTADERPKTELLLVRLLFEQNELPRGCAALRRALADVPAGSVEVRNQLTYYSPRCTAVDAGAGGRMPVNGTMVSAETTATPAPKPSATAGSEPRRAAREPKAVAPRARYTLQVAAYTSKSEAEALVRKLKARKLDARVVGTSKLYRVRIGKFVNRSAAVAMQRELKTKKISAIVAELEAGEPQ